MRKFFHFTTITFVESYTRTSLSTSYGLIVKWKKVKSESESEWKLFFWSLNFFVLKYVKGGVLGYNNIGIKKCRTTLLLVLNFGQIGELPQEFLKSPSRRGF